MNDPFLCLDHVYNIGPQRRFPQQSHCDDCGYQGRENHCSEDKEEYDGPFEVVLLEVDADSTMERDDLASCAFLELRGSVRVLVCVEGRRAVCHHESGLFEA